MQSTSAYLSLGSNIEPEKNLAFAVNDIQKTFPNSIVSSVYQTTAEGFEGDDFLNLAIALQSQQNLKELLIYTNGLEQQAGRSRVKRGNFDARTLDVDIVVFGDLIGNVEGRVWPAEDLTEYGHVLKPLAEIAPKDKEPIKGRTFQQLWDQFERKTEFEISSKVYDLKWLFENS